MDVKSAKARAYRRLSDSELRWLVDQLKEARRNFESARSSGRLPQRSKFAKRTHETVVPVIGGFYWTISCLRLWHEHGDAGVRNAIETGFAWFLMAPNVMRHATLRSIHYWLEVHPELLTAAGGKRVPHWTTIHKYVQRQTAPAAPSAPTAS